MKIIDITQPISAGKQYYPTLPPPKIDLLRHYSMGHDHWVSSIQLPLHSATHIDTPAHFSADGETVERIPIEALISFAYVIDCSRKKVIKKEDLREKGVKFRALLFKTKNDLENYTYFDVEAAKFIVENGVKIIGTESQSVDRFGDKTYPVHKIFSKQKILIVEGLNLKEVDEGAYVFICIPLLLLNAEAAPARALLIQI